MKKVIAGLLLLSILCLFSSCTLHLGTVNVELPWWVMTVVVVIPSLAVMLVIVWYATSKNRKGIYVCPHCRYRFKPGIKILYSLHVNDDYVLTCPHCGKRDWCAMSYDQEDE